MPETGLIHIVDDDEPVRTALRFALEASGLTVASYVDAADFLAQRSSAGGILVCDVRMPGMSGVELAQHLRRDGGGMPIILTTGNANRSLKQEAEAAGVQSVLEKPVSLGVLLAELTRLRA